MSAKFEFDERAFRRAIGDKVNKAMDERAAALQKVCDDAAREGSGDVARIHAALRSGVTRLGWSADGLPLQEYAEALAAGRRINVRADHLSW